MTSKLYGRHASGSKHVIERQQELEAAGWSSKSDEDRYLMNSCKLPWHEDRLREFLNNPTESVVAPLHIDMGIATGCNMACHFCYGIVQARTGFQGKQGGVKFMPLQTIKSVFAEAKSIGVKSIALIGEGENTINPALYPALEYSNEIDLDVSLATHGASIKQEHYDLLLRSLSWLRINISAATPESYQYVHQRPWFDKVMKNTAGLIEAREKKSIQLPNGESCTIGYQMVLTKRNFDDVIPLSKLAVAQGLDYLVVKACSDTPDGQLDAPQSEYLQLKEVFDEAEALSNERTKIIVRWEKLGNEGDKSYQKCFGTRFIIAISGSGNVFPCGHWFDIEKDRFLMGNVNLMRLSEILASKQYANCQNEVLGVDLRSCETNCRQHQVNIFLDNLMREVDVNAAIEDMKSAPLPKHINFI